MEKARNTQTWIVFSPKRPVVNLVVEQLFFEDSFLFSSLHSNQKTEWER